MSTAEEATINPDGSQTFEDEPPPMNDTAGEEGAFDAIPEEETGIDPAFYLLGAFILFVIGINSANFASPIRDMTSSSRRTLFNLSATETRIFSAALLPSSFFIS